jgi:methionine salvage enolase-phosphatase E1
MLDRHYLRYSGRSATVAVPPVGSSEPKSKKLVQASANVEMWLNKLPEIQKHDADEFFVTKLDASTILTLSRRNQINKVLKCLFGSSWKEGVESGKLKKTIKSSLLFLHPDKIEKDDTKKQTLFLYLMKAKEITEDVDLVKRIA